MKLTESKRLLFDIILVTSLICFYYFGRSVWYPLYLKINGKRTVGDIIEKYGSNAMARLIPYFKKNANSVFPPKKIILVAVKDEKIMELWSDDGRDIRLIRKYPIQAASGNAGPKLREGDRQVPEGIYGIIGLNPNSSYHLSIKLNYPNTFDMKHAEDEGRKYPGSDIFIHGRDASIGCLAMGDRAIEELFVLAEKIGIKNVKVILMPYDFRVKPVDVSHAENINWLPILYGNIKKELSVLKSDFRDINQKDTKGG